MKESPVLDEKGGSTLTLEEIQNFEGKYPKQLYTLFFAEMWERFTFYGMRALLMLFMTKHLFLAEDVANIKYGVYNCFVYAMGVFGGMYADKLLGARKSIRFGGILMAIGSFTLILPFEITFYIGMSIIIVGNGFFKPNISTMVGRLYKPNDSRREAGFSLFYSGINLGALLGSLLCGWIGQQYSWHLGFGLAGAFMLLGLFVFHRGQRILGPIGLAPNPAKLQEKNSFGFRREMSVYLFSILLIPIFIPLIFSDKINAVILPIMIGISLVALTYILFQVFKFTGVEIKKMIAAIVLIIFSVLFWAFYEQSGGSLNIFAERNVDMNVFGATLPSASVNNSLNPLYIIIFSPLIGLLWVALASKRIEPNAAVKFAFGLALLGLSYYIFASARYSADEAGKISLAYFALGYFVMTLGELCLSPIGLSMVTRLSPDKMQGQMMGLWFLASAMGQLLAGWIGSLMAVKSVDGEKVSTTEALSQASGVFEQIAYVAVLSAILLLILSPFIAQYMKGGKKAKAA